MARELGRIPASDDKHIQRYGITTATIPAKPTPVALGIDWHENFDEPVWYPGERIWRIGAPGRSLGALRGGHAVCALPIHHEDLWSWWVKMNQGQEGACVGFAATRMMMILNRMSYDPRWLYTEAKKVDEWSGEDYDGTSVRAAMDVLREKGHRRVRGTKTYPEDSSHGIQENRWTRSVDEVIACLKNPVVERRYAIPIANSWGNDGRRVGTSWVGSGYPHIVYLDLDVLARLLANWGDATVVTDR
jgi:hypothetical protein